MEKYITSVISSFKFCHLASFSDVVESNKARDSFLFIVFTKLFNVTNSNTIEIEDNLSSLNAFYDYLSKFRLSLPSKSALSQVIEDAVACFEEAEQSKLLSDIQQIWADLEGLDEQLKGISPLDAVNFYRGVFLPIQQMNSGGTSSITVDQIQINTSYAEILSEISPTTQDKRWYLGNDYEVEDSISLIAHNKSLPLTIKNVEQGPRHLLRYLSLVNAEDIQISTELLIQKSDMSLEIIAPNALGINFAEINSKSVANDKEKPEIKLKEYPTGLHLIASLSDEGTGYFFLSKGALNRQGDSVLRQEFVESGYVNTVVMLPEKLFGKQSYELILIILKPNSDTIRFVDARHCYQISNGTYKPSRLPELARLLDVAEAESDLIWNVPLNIILNNNYSLNPHAYESISSIEDKGLTELATERKELFEQLSALQDNIDGQLKLIGK